MTDIREITSLKNEREIKLNEIRKLDEISMRRRGLFETNIALVSSKLKFQLFLVFDLSLAPTNPDHYQYREMLQIAESTKLKNEAKAIDAKISEIRMQVRENMKKHS